MPNDSFAGWKEAHDTLYPFQKEGVKYLIDHGGGFLWDEPGLGKTRQAILAARLLGGHVLVVCPNTLKQWWRTEIGVICPGERIEIAGVGGRFGERNVHPLPEAIPRWTIVHYTGLRLNKAALCRVPWSVVVADECHFAKNRKADRTRALTQVTPVTAYRIGLTATPFGNNPSDLWAQLRWMAPHVNGLRSFWRFFETFVDYEYEVRGQQHYRRVKGGKHLNTLAKVMAGYGIRRAKQDVAKHLPPITDTRMPLEMDANQMFWYETLRKKTNVEVVIPHTAAGDITPGRDASARSVGMTGLVDVDVDGQFLRIIIPNMLARLVRMEQWLSHPWTFKPGTKGAKLEWLLEWADGYKLPAVIATRFRASAERIAEELKPRCRHHITGGVSVGSRSDIIEAWRKGEHQFLVGTMDTIGTGLSFERAHVMVCYDQLYSTVKMEQVRQRVHRITTDHPVQVIYLYIQDTTNEIVLDSFIHSWQQIEVVRAFLRHIQQGG